jgi:flagellar biosynthesis/type III secretory pathway protein FliH
MAERICRVKLAQGDEHVRPLLEEVIDHTGTRGRMVLRIHSLDAEAARAFLGTLHAALADDGTSPVTLVPDDAITRGGCVAERINGKVDAQVETQIQRLAAELIGAECPIRTQSAGEQASGGNA